MNRLTAAQQRWLVLLGCALLALLLLTPQLRQQRLAAIDSSLETATATPPITASQRAALARQRQQTQTLLAEIAVAQESLQASQPERWSASEFATLQNFLEQGDRAFASSQFAAALNSYRQAFDTVQQILALRPQRLAAALRASERAYHQFAATELDNHLAIAKLLVDATDTATAQQLLQWRRQQGQLAATQQAVETINRALENQQLAAASDALQRASAEIDQQHPAIQRLTAQLADRQRQADYTAALNSGYRALSAGQLDGAATAFSRAAALLPDSDSAASGLQQVANQRRQNHIDRQLADAERYEQREQWSQAVATYRQLEALAPGLLEAQVRLLSSSVRADFDQQWQDLTRSPYNLVSAQQQRAAQQWLAQAEQITPRGARLAEQIAQLQLQLQQSAEPQSVVLLSDGQTEVTLFKVAELGRFNQQLLELLPGRYTALGSCVGRRDRQVQFDVALQRSASAPLTIEVTCGERL